VTATRGKDGRGRKKEKHGGEEVDEKGAGWG
jgi:hypothetical protein